jgi:ERF superfamily
MLECSPEFKDIAQALLEFQGDTTGVYRSEKNPAFKSTYASLENVIDTARPVLQKVGIVFIQAPGALANGMLAVTTMLIHPKSGQWIRSTVQIPLGGKQDAQAVGSASTYGMRYTLMAALGLPPTKDDDAQAARPDETAKRNAEAQAKADAEAKADKDRAAREFIRAAETIISSSKNAPLLATWWNSEE